MQVSTREFEFSHGKKPRGEGHWAFAQNCATPFEQLIWLTGLYSGAKKTAIVLAKELGWDQLEVRP